jgi:hypothetical protein
MAMKQFTPDLEHLLMTADIPEKSRAVLNKEGIYTVDELVSAEYRICNGSMKLRKGIKIELVNIICWIRSFEKKHARMPEILTEFTEASFEKFQCSLEGVIGVNDEMMMHVYAHLFRTGTEKMTANLNA